MLTKTYQLREKKNVGYKDLKLFEKKKSQSNSIDLFSLDFRYLHFPLIRILFWPWTWLSF